MYQRHFQNPVKHLRWNCFHKKLHLRYLTGYQIRVFKDCSARNYSKLTEFIQYDNIKPPNKPMFIILNIIPGTL